MIKYCISPTPPPILNIQSKRICFFHSTTWQNVLSTGFNCRTLYVYEISGESIFIINVFVVGPFRIGYLGFPIGTTLRGLFTKSHLDALLKSSPPIDILRIPTSSFNNQALFDLKHHITQETRISNLSTWNLVNLKKLRRDSKKAMKSGLMVTDLRQDDDGIDLYNLYKSTIKRNGGDLRYTPSYFRELSRTRLENKNIRIFAAYKESKLAAYVVTALHDSQAYYLHGATAPEFLNCGASDLLLIEAINWAKLHGMEAFNLMCSNPEQRGLIRYKEKFGGETRPHFTYEVAVKPLSAYLFQLISTARLVFTTMKFNLHKAQ